MNVLRLPLRPLPLWLVVGGGVLLVLAGAAGGLLLGGPMPLLGAGLVLALAGAGYLAVWTSPALLVSLGVGAAIFSGNSSELGLPLPPDRPLILAGLASLALGLPGATRRRALIWRPVHLVLAAVAALGVISALRVGTLTTEHGIFSLLDRLGIIPFLLFTLAPLLFSSERDRNALLGVLVGVGAYLSTTAILEATGGHGLIFPSYITDPSVGIHFGRARGPFVEAVGMGSGLFFCSVGAAVAYATWPRSRGKTLAGVVAILCVGGTIFTLTRAIWLATALAVLLSLMANYRTRAVLVPVLALAVVALLAALTLVPGFAEQAEDRTTSQRPLWDRFNTNQAALSMVRDEPLVGVGWNRFIDESNRYMRLADDYPLTGSGIPVHNVMLSHAAELGLPTAALWLAGLLLAVGNAVLRPGPASLDPWRLGTVALFVHWLVVASFGPLGQAFPNVLLWLWAGIAATAHLSVPLAPNDSGRTAPVGGER